MDDEKIIRDDGLDIDKKLSLALEANADGIWEWNFAKNEINILKNWRTIFGYKKEEIPEDLDSFLKLIHPDDRKLLLDVKDKYYKELNSKLDIKFRIKGKDSEYKWVVSRGQIVRDKNNNMIIIGAYTEITKNKELQDKLIDSEKRYRQLIEFLPEAIFVRSNEQIIFANSKAAEILGYPSKEELLNKTIFDFLHPDYHSIAKERIKFLKEGKDFDIPKFELKFVKKDRQVIIVEVRTTKFNFNGISSILIAARDITERINMENELKNTNKKLEETISKLKDTQIQLIQQEKLAGIGQLAAGIAHEINNPLGYIASNFDTLAKYFKKYKEVMDVYRDTLQAEQIKNLEQKNKIDFINEDIGELFKDTREGINRVSEIVNGLRLFSRVDLPDDYIDYDINEGIKNTLIVAKNAIKYHAKVEESLNEVPLIKAIGGQVNQVLLNIILNAVYAIKEKGKNNPGIIKIRTYKDESYVYCEIEDNGIGIPQENFTSIFNPFFTTKPEKEGTGLGLSIAHEIITYRHKGEISLYSQVGVGTVFKLRLPINEK